MPASGLAPLLLALCLGAAPKEHPVFLAESAAVPVSESSRGDGSPSPELLEFLGEFSTPESGFLDPQFVDRMLPRLKSSEPE